MSVPLAPVTNVGFFQRLDLGDPFEGWYMVVHDEPALVVGELIETFDAFGVHTDVLDTSQTGPRPLTSDCDASQGTIATGIESWTREHAAELDLLRERIRDVRPLLVLVTTFAGAELLARFAPNSMSFFAETVERWEAEPVEHAQVELDLAALRARWGRTDADVLALAERGELPAEPDFYGWLVLLGRGDLLPDAAKR